MYLFDLDEKWCGQTQLPATYLNKLTETNSKPRLLVNLRLTIAVLMFAEICSYFLITLGFARECYIYFILGIILKVIGGIGASVLQNIAGCLWSLELHRYLNNLKLYHHEITGCLADKGCSETEIQALHSLPSEVYQSEVNSYRHNLFLNVGSSLACGGAILLNGEIISALIISLLGLISFPIGEYFFHKHTFRNDSKMRLGRSAQLMDFLKHVYREHILQTFQVNFLSQLPLLLFSARYILNGGGYALSSFFAYTQGLIGLTGTLSFQRSRISSLRTTETAKHLIDALSSQDFLITYESWKSHCQLHELAHIKKIENNLKARVAIFDFEIKRSFNNHKLLSPFSCVIPSGSICLLQAPSGRGKSTLLMGLNHILDHKGEMFFFNNGNWQNVGSPKHVVILNWYCNHI